MLAPSPHPATSINARSPGLVAFGRSFKPSATMAAIFSGQLRHIGNRSDRDDLQERVNLRFSAALTKQRMRPV